MPKCDPSEGATYPRGINHVGVGVADIERAMLGFTLLMGPMEVRAEPGYRANESQRCSWSKLQCDASSPYVSVNGIGIELFQLLERGANPRWSTGRVGSSYLRHRAQH
jgi:hypothetical protein